MANFSTNQVRHLYVADSEDLTKVGGIQLAGEDYGNNDYPAKMYFKYHGAGGLVRSDIIDVNTIKSITLTKNTKIGFKPKVADIYLNNAINSGQPIPGQDYMVRLVIRQFIGMSDEDTYIKYGIVHTVSGDTATTFYKKLAISLAKNFSREATLLFKFYCGRQEVTATTKEADLKDDDSTSVRILEVKQDWVRGTKQLTPVQFEVYLAPILYNGDERIDWATSNSDGTVTEENGKIAVVPDETAALIGHGEILADLEYFCMGERGDIYRNVGWPNVIPTTYLVDPTKTYDVIDIHYSYTGSNESVQKSEKDLTVLFIPNTIDNVTATLSTIPGYKEIK